MERQQKQHIINDLKKKMVFITGPRQVGKTWLAKEIARLFPKSVYLNYDSAGDRKIIKDEVWLEDTQLLILDELHKMKGWKNYLKGVYDTKPAGMMILVTGSARLEAFRQQGDSLAGRFFRHRLLPFSPAESAHVGVSVDPTIFLNRGGFPEPFLADNNTDADRWRMQYIDGLIRTDILDFERIHDFKAIQLILEMLRSRTGSPISYQSIAEDVSVSPNTVKKYIQILESLFIIFKVTPYSRNIARSVLKTPKIYFYDTGMVKGDEGAIFENMVALCLLKHVCARVDLEGKPASLHYIRTKDGAEVDFCLAQDNTLELLIEAKRSEARPVRALINFSKRYDTPATQLVLHLKRERMDSGVRVCQGMKYLESLLL
ncbi:MAG: ATP-binding protein [Proteobacteria bacterium]|nr:ATP-binding protein [Pseudomonadota bacterium]MBU1697506.1 ATP-binding protein [Pseudomonadota bacterium]